ncbi:uncharacterized protein EAE97_006213 [Botrytis byssoidea]|uniref:Uncharacterized protein n=1 Tax=Botrytis byssoidea TaxID=139641 RepID=A0A9P5LZ19_9HELO|nr:uncharacterized protein EAE97_006213 [Botrytis byssoidea]KAF7942759.1 hypothetical protein EAE97_006213 [Botrytis byssoidea]
MPCTKKWKVVLRDDRDDPDESVLSLACSNSARFRQPIVLKPGIIEQRLEGNEVIQRWGLPTPCECEARDNTADVIVSAIGSWKPSALLKMLDLSISQFYWSTSTYNMEFFVKRSWKFLRVTLDKRALTYHIHDDDRWQLLGSEHLGIEDICTLEDHYKKTGTSVILRKATEYWLGDWEIPSPGTKIVSRNSNLSVTSPRKMGNGYASTN